VEQSISIQLPQLAFIGAGNIANALVTGLIGQDYPISKLSVADPIDDQLKPFRAFGIKTSLDNEEVTTDADVVLLCVKPNILPQAARSIADSVRDGSTLVVSVAAGITLASLAEWLGDETALVRCMPNTPALVQLGACGLFANDRVSEQQRNWTETILNAIGISLWVESESQIDTVTALSGSGPAYFFYLIEIMQKVGADLGLSQEVADKLVLQTALGAATMAHQSSDGSAELRRRVTSPGGTTQAALNQLMDDNLSDIIARAIKAAEVRSIELSNDQD
jgi:pyrroline-5-carboxylate reductase